MPSRALRREVTTIMERGAVVRTPFFIWRHLDESEAPFVVAAGKKTFRRAVDRNRVRRRVLAAAQIAGAQRPGTVIILRKAAQHAPFDQLLQRLARLPGAKT